jgi:hypothetical protein
VINRIRKVTARISKIEIHGMRVLPSVFEGREFAVCFLRGSLYISQQTLLKIENPRWI